MAEKLKELYKGVVTLEQIQESVDGNIPLYTTDATTKNVIKDIQFKGETLVPSQITNNGFPECSTFSNVTGSAIVDVNSSIMLQSAKAGISAKEFDCVVTGTGIVGTPARYYRFKIAEQDGVSDFVKVETTVTDSILGTGLTVTNRQVAKGSNYYRFTDFAASTRGRSFIELYTPETNIRKFDMFNSGQYSYVTYSPYDGNAYYRASTSANRDKIVKIDMEAFPQASNIPEDVNVRRVVFSDDGSYLYSMNSSNSTATTVYREALATPYDLRSVTEVATYQAGTINNLGGEALQVISFQFSADGTKLYMLHSDRNIYQVTLTTPWDLSAGTGRVLSNRTFGGATDFYVHFDGTFIITKESGGALKKYLLTTAFDISTVEDATESYTDSRLNNTGQFTVSKSGNYIMFFETAQDRLSKIVLNNGNFSLAHCTLLNGVRMTNDTPSDGSVRFYNTAPFAVALSGDDSRVVVSDQFRPVSYRINIATYNHNLSNSLDYYVSTSITLNNNLVSPLPTTTVNQRLFAEGKYIFYTQNDGDNIYVIDTTTWNVGLLQDVGLSDPEAIHSFSVHYYAPTDEYCLFTEGRGTNLKTVRYVPASVVDDVCSTRGAISCSSFEGYSTANNLGTFGTRRPSILINKYFIMSPKDNIGTSTNIDLYDIRTGIVSTIKTFNFLEEYLASGANLQYISPAITSAPNSATYTAFNKDLDIRISGVEITEEV